MNADGFDQLRAALAATYGIERELGEGGMAVVYAAFDHKHRRRVALKLLRGNVFEQGAAERFLREIRLTARLSHPNIVPLLDSGEVLGLPFYVMPLIQGESLRDRLAREPRLPIDDAINIALEVADALAYAHAQEIVHRDIKPANIMLAGRHAIVADFGVAKAMTSVAPTEEITDAGLAVGTIAYMSPEQALGERFVDSRSDIFSLGVVLYEMLTGERAFSGATPQATIARRFSGVVPSARAHRPEVPYAVERVVVQSLAPNPDERFASAGEFEAALSAAWRSSSLVTGGIRVSGSGVRVPSLAVLPFENLSDDPENEYLSDGITEEILTLLSLRRTIRVCARVSSFAFKNKQADVRTIGSKLGVGNVLLGSVRRSGGRLRVTAQLVDANDGFQLWSDRYDRTVSDVFAIQDEISAAIVFALRATLSGAEMPAPPKPPQPAPAVYETYLRGRYFWNWRTEDATRRAIACFHEAIALDARYAPAHAGLADALVTMGVYGASAPNETMPAARRAADAALALDPALAEARTALALVRAAYDWEWSVAERTFREAIALNPMYPAAHQGLASVCLVPQHRFDDALAAIHAALRLDPLSPVLRATLSSTLLYARRFDEAARAAEQVLELVSFAPAHFFLSQALVRLGQHEQAIAHGERAVELSGRSSETLAALGHAVAVAGDVARARSIRDQLEERSRTVYVSPAHPALIDIGIGEPARALDRLEEAVRLRAADVVWLGVRPSYDPLRGDARFDALLRTAGLESRAR
jgi:serine/threonine protein kinase/tetratricopeptide (TPR) repeat protein